MIQHIKSFAQRLGHDEDGVTMLEYTILIGIITAGVIASVSTAGTWASGKWTTLVSFLK